MVNLLLLTTQFDEQRELIACKSIHLVGKEFARYFLDTTSPLNSTICYQYAVIVILYACCSMWS